MGALIDHYSRNARLSPAFIVAIPLSVTSAAFGSTVSGAVATLIGAASALSLTALLTQLGRDRGKLKEVGLFEMWGGKPSVAKLRHTDTSINPNTRSRYIEKAKRLLPEIEWPTAVQEAADVNSADQKYEALSNLLLERTRDSKKFPLIYLELVNYGFRRNLWGLKPIGLTCAIIAFVAIIIAIIFNLHSHTTPTYLSIAAACTDAIFILLWAFWISPDWIKITADAYAERLLSSLEQI